jgi:hypothetical protein
MNYKEGDKLVMVPYYMIDGFPCTDYTIVFVDDDATAELRYEVYCTCSKSGTKCGELWYSEEELNRKFHPKIYIEIRDMFSITKDK